MTGDIANLLTCGRVASLSGSVATPFQWMRRRELSMNSAQRPALTNVGIYRSIADCAYRQMAADMAENLRPGSEGSDVVVKTFDPEQLSFKQAMISVVFTCIWLEAALHLLIVGKLGREAYTKKVDRSGYGTKLSLLG